MWRTASVVAGLRRACWMGGEPDPRALQGAFTALVAVVATGTLPTAGDEAWLPASVAAGVAALAFLCTLVLTPRSQDLSRLLRWLAVVDLAVIGLSALQLDVGTLPMVVVPAVWLGRLLRWRGVLVSGVATLALVTAPAIALHGNYDDTAAQVIALPFVAMFGSMAIAVGLASADRSREEAEAAAHELAVQRGATEAFVAAVDVGLARLDRDGRVLLTNRRQTEIDALKYPRGRDHAAEHVYAADGRTPLAPGDLPSVVAARGEEFDDLRIWVGENPHTRRVYSVSARSVRDDHGERIGSALAYQEVTDLVRALAVKDEFVGLVSHELRTPLTSIYGYVCLLRDREDLPALAVRQLDTVARSTDRLQVLVDDLLQATQVAGGGLRLKRGVHDLARIVTDAAASARPHAETAGIELRVDVPGAVLLEVDRVRIAQVVDNLLTNAIKYTQPGGWASLDVVDGPDEVLVQVRDNGIGIRSEDLAQVFGRFYRTREVAERAIQGVGLGLAITRTIVEQHGGRIEVESRPGAGSEFRVRLPRIADPLAAERTPVVAGADASRLAP